MKNMNAVDLFTKKVIIAFSFPGATKFLISRIDMMAPILAFTSIRRHLINLSKPKIVMN